MILAYLKRISKLASVIFTVIIVFQLTLGQQLNNNILCVLLILSLFSSLIKVIMNKYVISKDSIFNPLLYIILVWLIVIASNYIFHMGMSLLSIFLTFFEVILIYVCVRLINYQYDKIEVKKMNEILDKNRKNKQ